MVSVQTKVTITGDRDGFERVSKRLRRPAEFMRMVGVQGMAGSAKRAQAAFSQSEGIRTGVLVNSLGFPRGVRGNARRVFTPNADTIFEVSADRVAIGSTVTYAAMRNFGGVIEPKEQKALAIPLTPALKRSGLGPRDVDPERKLLRFHPYTGGKPNVFALLIDDAAPLTGRQRKKRGQTPYGPGPLFALVYWVRQEGAHFMGWDDEDIRMIEKDLLPEYLGLN